MSKRVIVTVAGTTRDLPLEGAVVVGRDPLCTISVDDPQLSRRHAEVVSTAFGTRVRDLGSQNGIFINGVQVTEGLLQPDDVVQVASLALRVVENDDANDGEPVAADRGTAILTRPPARPASRAGDLAPAAEMTREEAEPTPGASPDRAGSVEHRTPRGSWRGRVMLASLVVAVVTFGLAALPSLWWYGQERGAAERREATVIAGRLAADAARAIEADRAVARAADQVLHLPGVSEALVLSPEGRILAPASRAGQSLSTLDGSKQGLAEVVRERSAVAGGVVEVARPVAIDGNPRAAIAWIAFDPTEVSHSSLTWLVPALLVACAVGLLSGWFLAQRSERALAALNEQLDAMLAGQIDVAHDPLGARPVRNLADTLNYLVTRLRASASGDLRRVRASAGESSIPAGLALPSRASSPQSSYAVGASHASNGTAGHAAKAAAGARHAAPSLSSMTPDADPDVAPGEASLVASPELRIIRANEACATVLGASPERVMGLHLLDAIPNSEIADAVLMCLSRLAPGGQVETYVASASSVPLRVRVGRTGKDAPVNIVFRLEEVQAE